MEERIVTTEAKAKEIKHLVDKIITNAKKIQADPERKVAVIRDLNNKIPRKAVEKLTGDFLNTFSPRTSGYTRITKLGSRKSDSAHMAIIEFVDRQELTQQIPQSE